MKRPGKLSDAWKVLTGQLRTAPIDPDAAFLPDQVDMLIDAIKSSESHWTAEINRLFEMYGREHLAQLHRFERTDERLTSIEATLGSLSETSSRAVLLRVEDHIREERDFWASIRNRLDERFPRMAVKP